MAEALQQVILDTLDAESTIKDTRALVLPGEKGPAISNDAQIATLGALNSLSSRDVSPSVLVHRQYLCSRIVEQGSNEARVWAALPLKGQGEPITPHQLKKAVGDEVAKVGQGRAFKNGWIVKEGDGLVKSVNSDVHYHLSALTYTAQIKSTGTLKSGEKALADLRKRKLIVQKKVQWFSVTKGPSFSTSIAKPETDLTVEMLASGSWKTSAFKKYNFEAEGIPTNGEEIRNIFLEMGFAEMPTQSFVESGFWCFDALFVPQQHPARDLQDTFYLSDPAISLPPKKDYYDLVSKVHEHGGFGSTGYRAPWVEEESRKLLLRTHTTASSAHMLYKLAAACRGEKISSDKGEYTHGASSTTGSDRGDPAQDDGFRPAKLFSIDRVFRNETMDATHLAEFHQVEGVVADRNLTLADLIAFPRNLRFPPNAEPMVEVGNSGMFRPEMLEPMGFPKDVRVHGWGLSLERPTMIRYGINNIRTLVGHKVSIEGIENSPAVRF
ncbi:Phenylalanyl-tRNA synthetase, beta [Salix suchowensis]|nr:Phenylalanyl-tRNA synthetase, beta [Salix suchowensis]